MNHWWLKKSATFEVKNGAYDPENIAAGVFGCIRDRFKTEDRIDGGTGEISALIDYIKTELGKLDLSHYYMPDGRKITKPIKKILSKIVKKEPLNRKFADLCNAISQLYSPKHLLTCRFGDTARLGSGKYEGERTCFADGGISGVDNSASRKFLERYVRTECLLLEKDGKVARSIIYFAGGRNIFLTNFYFSGIENNSLLFVEGFRHLFGLEKVIWSYCNAAVGLPIYLNANASRTKSLAIHIKTERSFDWPYMRYFPCPWCDEIVPEKNFHHEVDGSVHLIGCSESCAENGRNEEDDEPYSHCHYCEDPIQNQDDAYWVESLERDFCHHCYDEHIYRCDHCGYEHYNNHFHAGADGKYYCDDCAARCEDCGEYYPNKKINGNDLCPSCQEGRDEKEADEESDELEEVGK